jgi:high affinity sulfate transporter 1
MPTAQQPSRQQPLIFRIAPGLRPLLGYRFGQDFRFDLVAGVSVAAVALPVAVAYAELAGFTPEVGLYSCILPLVAYAIFGTSRNLMVNPDAAACAMVASAVAPLAHGDADLYASISITLATIAGVYCIIASFFRLGALADFLSKPILVGFLNGIAISIFLGQVGKLCGFSIKAGGIIPRIVEIAKTLPQTHWPTLAVAVGAFAIIFASKRFLPRLPSALVAMILASAAVAIFKLDAHGVAILGKVKSGLPHLRLPTTPLRALPPLMADAAGMALVLFTSGMLTARSFAARGGYEIDVDQEFAAFGFANIASALSQGFAVTGADSRTAMAQSSGGRTQVTGLVAAATIAIVLLFLTSPLQYVPVAALGAVLIVAAFSLFDTKTLREIWKVDKGEVVLSIITTLGVVAVGAINAILLAVGLALVKFVHMTARPGDEVLGKVEGLSGFHSIERHPGAETFPGLVMYRFGSPITFFNSAYFKERVLAVVDAAMPGVRWVVIDLIPISHVDVTGVYAVRDLRVALKTRGVTLILAGRKTEYLNWLRECGLYREEDEQVFFPTMRQAFRAFQSSQSPSS